MTAGPSGDVSRNARCPCGSGRRYKECHGAPHAAARPGGRIDELKGAALAAQQAGRLDEAAGLYRRALDVDPADFDALHMLGVTRLMQYRFDEAAGLIARALDVRPGVVAAIRNLGIARDPHRARQAEGYRTWCATRERRRDAEREGRRRAIALRADAPVIAVVLPVFDPPAEHLRACLDSVFAQTYGRFELCIADDASRAPHVAEILRDCAARDPRVRLVFRERNGHISAASNSAVALATAPFVALLDHDDLLAPSALAEMALAIDAHPDAAILYSDEDKLDESGERIEPYFKPAWNPALLRSQNVVSHLGVYRRPLVEAVGGFREGYEGAQDWDLALRCSERVGARAVLHVPQVLYHWRRSAASTAAGHAQKAYAASAQERTVADAWARRGVDVAISRVGGGHHLRADPRTAPTVSLVVLSRDGTAGTPHWCTAPPAQVQDVEVVALEAGPAGGEDADPVVLSPGEARRINEAASRGRGEVLVFLRADVDTLPAEALRMLAAHAALDGAGPAGGDIHDRFGMAIGGAWLLDAGTIVDAAFAGPAPDASSAAVRSAVVQNVAAVRGDAMAIRRALWRDLGGYDAGALACRYHDVDLCLRAAERGCRATWHPSAVFRVSGTLRATRPEPATDDDAQAMRRRHAERLARDPAYHPELDRAPRRFAFRADDGPADADAR